MKSKLTVKQVGLLEGLLFLKRRMDSSPATHCVLGMDVAFQMLLFFTSLTGLLLLILRETLAMGILLTAHLGLVRANGGSARSESRLAR